MKDQPYSTKSGKMAGEVIMMGAEMRKSDSPSSVEIIAGVLPFVTIGMELVFSELSRELFYQPWMVATGGLFFLSTLLLLPAVGVCLGWLKGFPRWAYPYISQALIFYLYLSGASTPGISLLGIPLFGRDLWGVRAYVPLVVAILIAILLTRSLESFTRLFTNAWQDWTRITFGLFGILPIVVWISFDEVNRGYSLPFMIFTAALFVITAWFYMYSKYVNQRIAALFTGAALTVFTSAIGSIIYWYPRGGVNIPAVIVSGVIILAIMLLPGMIGIYHWRARESTAG